MYEGGRVGKGGEGIKISSAMIGMQRILIHANAPNPEKPFLEKRAPSEDNVR